MKLADIFVSKVTRDIPPVVYFHDQAPQKLADEVAEYIITGGYPENHPHHRRVPSGIHEEYVGLLTAIADELDKPSGPDLPTAWISGFYGSGKSSFAKLLGLSLDGVALPNGRSLAEAWLARDSSPKAAELAAAWKRLRAKVDPIAVVFDIGAVAREGDQIHSAAVRQVQKRLGYSHQSFVADTELKLEREGHWERFIAKAQEVLGKPWSEKKDGSFAEEDFSLVLHHLFPDHYPDPTSWFAARAGMRVGTESPEEAFTAIAQMIAQRKPGATLFLVVDEVSQFVLASKDRVDRLRAFATALGRHHGKVWLFALGQQKLDEGADDSFLVWAKDRFPPKLRVHLAATNIRDVVHKRLLQKKPEHEAKVRELFDKHRPELKLYAFGCEDVIADDFVETYPMLPGQIDLILRITSALRLRSNRAQGDDQAIRGLLQLLGELFRSQNLADEELGALVTLDRVYEVQHTALDSDAQASMARVLAHCTSDADALQLRAAKAVALLELVSDTLPTDAKLVAQCLFDRVDRGNQLPAVTEALETLRRRNLLGYSEKHGYKLQSSSAEEWERERRDQPAVRDAQLEVVQEALKWLVNDPEQPRLQGRPFPFKALFSDGRRLSDVLLTEGRADAVIELDLRFLPPEDARDEPRWVRFSAEQSKRLLWIAGDLGAVEDTAKELVRSRAMVKKYTGRRDSLSAPRKLLLQQEDNRAEDLDRRLRESVADAWMAGRLYFGGRALTPVDHGQAFGTALHAAGTRVLPELFVHFDATQVQPSELKQLFEAELVGPSPKFLAGEIGILEVDGGKFVATCTGTVPKRILEHIESLGDAGTTGSALQSHFGAAPFGYAANLVKACVVGLLRAKRIHVQTEAGELSDHRQAGVRDLEQDRVFRRAAVLRAEEDGGGLGPADRARIQKFFATRLGVDVERDDYPIADAVSRHFPAVARRLRDHLSRLDRLPRGRRPTPELDKLALALEQGLKNCRDTKATVATVRRHLDALNEGLALLSRDEAELTDVAMRVVREADEVVQVHAAQLEARGRMSTELSEAAERIHDQLEDDRAWVDAEIMRADMDALKAAYVEERTALLAWQEREAEAARTRVKSRDGFATLTSDQSHRVLRPFAQATTATTPEAIAPALSVLHDAFEVALRRAEEEAHELLDAALSEGEKPAVVRVKLGLSGREVGTEAEVEALVEDVRKTLMAHVKAGVRVRIG
ncbi:MAG: BREX system P-loop protein BrxC [Sandaracinus sp.]|nr:BREX system P-loop protein BrxC [Sandaracinus sp.]MCB9635204.1 BREX system P-loop protein BrxC [Sandaracinus sp.]